MPTVGSKDVHKLCTRRDRRRALFPLTPGQKTRFIEHLFHPTNFPDEGALFSDYFVSEVFEHDVLGTRLEHFQYDSAKLHVSPFVDDSRLSGFSCQFT